MTTRRDLTTLAALLALVATALAQSIAAPLTPPAVLGAAKTVQFTATLFRNGKPEEVSVAYLAQPNKAFVQDRNAKTKRIDIVYASDGKTQIEYRRSRRHYTQSTAPASINDADTHTLALSALADFIDPAAFGKLIYEQTGRMRPHEKPLAVYDKGFGRDAKGQQTQEDIFIDPVTGLPEKVIFVVLANEAHGVSDIFQETARIEFRHWNLNAPIDKSKFTYAPPASATLYTPPKMLAEGTLAPDFTANDKDGHPIHLSDFRGKMVVLDFWATWCGPCQMSLPHTTKVAKQYASKGVTVLAVNVWDTPQAFHAWLPKHRQYGGLRFVIDPAQVQDKGIATSLYGVSGIPTQYVIGRDGRIVKSIVGYEAGSTALEDALKAAGAG